MIKTSPFSLRRLTLVIFWGFIGLLLLVFLASCQTADAPPPAGDAAADRLKLLVQQDGFVRVSQTELANAGLSFSAFDAANLRLTDGETAVPFHIADDHLIFYGQRPTNRYTAYRPYILTAGITGETMAETPAPAPTDAPPIQQISRTLRLEENRVYDSQARDFSHTLQPETADEDIDLWFWQPLRQGNSLSFDFDLPLIADGSGQIWVQMRGESYNAEVEDDHDYDVIINGQNIGTIRFDGQIFHTGSLDIPPGLLQQGKNSLVLDNSVPGATFLDIMQLNWIEIEYATPPEAVGDQAATTGQSGNLALSGFSGPPDLYDISQPQAPRRLTGAITSATGLATTVEAADRLAAIGPTGYAPAVIQPVRASELRNPDNGADLIIVTTDALAPALQPLIEQREAEGLRVVVAPVAEIYDEFGYGANTPQAINAFVSHAYENWQAPAPRYLFLVGDATADYRDHLGLAPANLVPAPMIPVSYSGETVSDARLADVTGDTRPELAVGRWPVDSPTAVSSLVERTLAYERGTAVDQAIFATDSSESHFANIAQRLGESGSLNDEQITLLNGPQASDLLASWREGAWLATYIGHGSLTQWGKENIFTLDAVNGLQGETPPIVLQLTCLTGLFNHPEQPSLAEMMLTHKQGPVLQVAATSLTLSGHQEPFAASLMANLSDPTIERIGDALQNAKLSLDTSNTGLREISDTFTLFGDPSTRILRPLP
jgi:hypothetical protein